MAAICSTQVRRQRRRLLWHLRWLTPLAAAGLALSLLLPTVHHALLPSADPFAVLRQWPASRTWRSMIADLDGDGRAEVLLNRHTAQLELWRFTGTGMAPVPWSVPANDRHDCAAADFDLDGRTDIICVAGGERGTGSSPNELWLQMSDGSFTDRAAAWGWQAGPTRSRTATVADYNLDGRPDVFVGSRYRAGEPDRLWWNEGQHVVPMAFGERNTTVALAHDWNGDGRPDILRAGTGRAEVLWNLSTGWHAQPLDVRAPWWYGGDVAPDGSVALVSATDLFLLQPDLVLRGQVQIEAGRDVAWTDQGWYVVQGGTPDAEDALVRDGHLYRLPATAGWQGEGESVATGDVDGDGRLDLLIGNGYAETAGPFFLLTARSTAPN